MQRHGYELSDGRLLFCVFLSFGVNNDAGISFSTTAGLGCVVDACRLTPFTLRWDDVEW